MASKARLSVLGAIVLAAVTLAAEPAWAQYGTSFYYYNPRTGRSYSQQVYVGHGAAYGGFSYSRPGRTYSAGSGYRGRTYYGHQFYASPDRVYGYRGYYGRGGR